ncbi:MAG: cysteine desulfurase [Actinomycetota bacterium]
MSRAYLDHASVSPLRPVARAALLAWLDVIGDPSRVHTEGRMVRAALEDARDQVAAFLGARPREVVFTSGATEAINAACFGAARRTSGGAFVAAAVEHSAVRDASAAHGEVRVPPVDGQGRIDVAAVTAELRGDVALAHCQWANHEVGTLQPVEAIAAVCHERGVLLHVDAAAAAGHVPIAFDASGVDLMSVSAPKLGGPPGVGALLVRRGLRVDPLMVGGDQERARRAGLENVAGAIAFGAACTEIAATLDTEQAAARKQTDALLAAATAVGHVEAYGDPVSRVPHIVCVGVDGVESEAVLLGLDQAGVAAHSGSACSSEALEPSPVLEAMGVDAQRSLRLSVGWSTTYDDVGAFAAVIGDVVGRLRALAR